MEPSRSRNPDKARRAAADPRRPGERCEAEPGRWLPRVDRARCEGKGDCVAVCPYDVFAIGRIDDDELAGLPWLARLKSRAHGRRTARLRAPDACRACGLCVVACPEEALRLAPVGS
jgi:NAD-dependent dihydropyrimidine dehydrogenase PreA subunit